MHGFHAVCFGWKSGSVNKLAVQYALGPHEMAIDVLISTVLSPLIHMFNFMPEQTLLDYARDCH